MHGDTIASAPPPFPDVFEYFRTTTPVGFGRSHMPWHANWGCDRGPSHSLCLVSPIYPLLSKEG